MPAILFLLLPFFELAAFIKIGGEIGVMATIFEIIITGFIGVSLIRMQGTAALMSMRNSMARGGLYEGALINALFIGISGFLLLLPGFLTDFLALILLIIKLPGLLTGNFRMENARGAHEPARIFINGEEVNPTSGQPLSDDASEIIDAEYIDVTDEADRSDR